jgi:hypothetical protein
MAEVKKQERDFTPEVDTLLPEATALAQAGSSNKACLNASSYSLSLLAGWKTSTSYRETFCSRKADKKCLSRPINFFTGKLLTMTLLT